MIPLVRLGGTDLVRIDRFGAHDIKESEMFKFLYPIGLYIFLIFASVSASASSTSLVCEDEDLSIGITIVKNGDGNVVQPTSIPEVVAKALNFYGEEDSAMRASKALSMLSAGSRVTVVENARYNKWRSMANNPAGASISELKSAVSDLSFFYIEKVRSGQPLGQFTQSDGHYGIKDWGIFLKQDLGPSTWSLDRESLVITNTGYGWFSKWPIQCILNPDVANVHDAYIADYFKWYGVFSEEYEKKLSAKNKI